MQLKAVKTLLGKVRSPSLEYAGVGKALGLGGKTYLQNEVWSSWCMETTQSVISVPPEGDYGRVVEISSQVSSLLEGKKVTWSYSHCILRTLIVLNTTCYAIMGE
ncbi:hypothetical protein Dimus_012696 [Dionaea muscipula]